jgi:S-adenosylmethionine decarboxylase
LIFVVIAEGTHLTLHTYPELGYAAADIFTTDSHCAPDKIMNALKKSLRSDKMKATNIKRGDFGSIADMKPKTKTSMTPLGRVKNLGTKVKSMIKKKKKKRK